MASDPSRTCRPGSPGRVLLLVAIVFFALVLVRHVAVLAGARDVPSEYEVVLPLEEGGRRLGGESAAPRPPSPPAPSASPPPPTAKAWARQWESDFGASELGVPPRRVDGNDAWDDRTARDEHPPLPPVPAQPSASPPPPGAPAMPPPRAPAYPPPPGIHTYSKRVPAIEGGYHVHTGKIVNATGHEIGLSADPSRNFTLPSDRLESEPEPTEARALPSTPATEPAPSTESEPESAGAHLPRAAVVDADEPAGSVAAVEGETKPAPGARESTVPRVPGVGERVPLPGLPSHCAAEASADFDGPALVWGMDHRVASAAACCEACRAHAEKHAGEAEEKRCNSWVFCPEAKCWAPDIWNHTKGECWLKRQEDADAPKVNFRGSYPPEFRAHHRTAPTHVAWQAGVLGASSRTT